MKLKQNHVYDCRGIPIHVGDLLSQFSVLRTTSDYFLVLDICLEPRYDIWKVQVLNLRTNQNLQDVSYSYTLVSRAPNND